MLSNTRRLARIAGFLGAVGGIFMILTGVPFLRESVGVEPTALHLTTWVLAFLLIAVGTIGYFVAGRQERDINVALGIMLAGGLVTAVGTTLMVPGVEAGWVLFPLGTVAHVLGLLLLGVTAVRNEAFMRPRWLPLLLGAGLFLLFIAAWSGETEQMFGVFVLALGMAWLLLGLLLAGGNVRSNATTPPTAA